MVHAEMSFHSEVDQADQNVSSHIKEVDFQHEIKKRDEIICRLSVRLKESVLERDKQMNHQFEQVQYFQQQIERLQEELRHADQKLQTQKEYHGEAVEVIENVKGNMLDIQSNLQNVTKSHNAVSQDVCTSTDELSQCNAASQDVCTSTNELSQCNAVSGSGTNSLEQTEKEMSCAELKQNIENMKVKHWKDLRMQEVELSLKYEDEVKEHKKKHELMFNQLVKTTTAQKQREFIKALQKMRKQFKGDSSITSASNNRESSNSPAPSEDGVSHVVRENGKQEKNRESYMVQKLSIENQELAEIRDILLQQADISHENQVLLKNELKSYTSQDKLSDADLFMEEIEKISHISENDVSMEWQLLSPCDGISNENNDRTSTTALGFFEHDFKDFPMSTDLNSIEMSNVQCLNTQCVVTRARLQELVSLSKLTSIPNSSPGSDSGIGDSQLKDVGNKLDEFDFGTPEECNSNDVAMELRQIKQSNKELEDKIEHQFILFAEEKVNLTKICDALKVQVENLLLAKSHLEQELEIKHAAILTLSEEFHNSLGRFEFNKDDRQQQLLHEDCTNHALNNTLPDHYSRKNEESGTFVREDDYSSLDLLLTQSHVDTEGDIEFWDTNFSNKYKTQSFQKQEPQVYEVDPELQLQGHSPTSNVQYLSELEEKERTIDDLVLQVNSLERQLKSSKQFISEQSGDRESERDDALREIERLRKIIEEKELHLKSNKNLYQEIGDMKDRIENLQEDLESLNNLNSDLRNQLSASNQRNTELEKQIKILETELEERNQEEEKLETGSLCQESTSDSNITDIVEVAFSETEEFVPFKKQKCDSESSPTPSCEAELRIKQLEDEVCALHYKLRQEKLIGGDLLKSLVAEQRRYNTLFIKEKSENSVCSTELLDQWVQISKVQNALMEEQNYCSSLLDVVEDLQNKLSKAKIRLKKEEEQRCLLEHQLSDARLQLLFPADRRNQIDKLQRLYARYLRAESYRKALIYQKKYLLILIGGYQDTEETTLSLIAKIGCPVSHSVSRYPYYTPVLHIFRRSVTVIIAIFRMKLMVKKWQRAVKVGSPVVCGTTDVNYGYLSSHSNIFAESNS